MNFRSFSPLLSPADPGALAAVPSPPLPPNQSVAEVPFCRADFGDSFLWGSAVSAFQVEGAPQADGKGESVWDRFVHTKGKVRRGATARHACDFYHRYPQDLRLARQLGLQHFRFSIAWTRLFPQGTGALNQRGLDYYNRLVDTCLENGLRPWVTLYHWDLPQALEDRGGWTNRDMLGWFSDYAAACAHHLGDRVHDWLVLNEPSAFVGFGYGTGYHAPGRASILDFLKAAHHAVLCQAEGGRVLRDFLPQARIGTSFATFALAPHRDLPRDVAAVRRVDALLNRLYVEPALGMGYPYDGFTALRSLEGFMQPGDEDRMVFDFDFIGVQYYCRLVFKFSLFPPAVFAKEVTARTRGVPRNNLGYEIYPEGMYEVLTRFGQYPGVRELIVSENGVSLDDVLEGDQINDQARIRFFESYLGQLLRAKREGANVSGFFVWSLLDNFEWAEGYKPRFGLVYVDFKTQQRYVKASARWLARLLGPH